MANVVSGTGSLTKEGSAIAALWNPNSYTGATVVNGGQLMLAGSGAISQSSTLQIASGASVRLTGYFAAADINRTFAGLTGAGILYGSGGTVTINKASGSDTFSGDIQGGQGLIKTGAGTLVLSGPNSYTGVTMVSSGELVISKASFTATITPVTISVTLSNIPSGGAIFAILPGSLSGTYGNPTVNNLGQGQTASFDASTGILSILQGSTGPTFEDAYPGGVNMTDIAPNGLTYLVNYAFGGSSTNPAKLPMQDTSDPSKLTLVAYVRTNNASGTLNVVGEKGATLDFWDTNNPIAGVVAQDQSDAPSGTQKRIFSTTNSGDRLFLRLKTTLQP
jgi:autotransporter-associated beta strand protein